MLEGIDALLPAETDAPPATQEVGRRIAEVIHAGDVLALYGELGAGKTELVRGLCRGLGVDEHEVNSPTFTIVNEYRSGRLPVFHFDAYRIRRVEEFYDLGYEDYFFDEGVSVVEWADRVEDLIPEDALRIRLDHVAGGRRRIYLVQR